MFFQDLEQPGATNRNGKVRSNGLILPNTASEGRMRAYLERMRFCDRFAMRTRVRNLATVTVRLKQNSRSSLTREECVRIRGRTERAFSFRPRIFSEWHALRGKPVFRIISLQLSQGTHTSTASGWDIPYERGNNALTEQIFTLSDIDTRTNVEVFYFKACPEKCHAAEPAPAMPKAFSRSFEQLFAQNYDTGRNC
jgi:hypothetical protein